MYIYIYTYIHIYIYIYSPPLWGISQARILMFPAQVAGAGAGRRTITICLVV